MTAKRKHQAPKTVDAKLDALRRALGVDMRRDKSASLRKQVAALHADVKRLAKLVERLLVPPKVTRLRALKSQPVQLDAKSIAAITRSLRDTSVTVRERPGYTVADLQRDLRKKARSLTGNADAEQSRGVGR